MVPTRDDLAKMHWRDRWEYEAGREAECMNRLTEGELLRRIERGKPGDYYSIWRAIGGKGSVQRAAMVLWRFLQANPGEEWTLHRYHCAAALFRVLGTPDPAVQNELRKRVQWDHEGEEARQEALVELRGVIEEKLI
jgi:hypothetical protein